MKHKLLLIAIVLLSTAAIAGDFQIKPWYRDKTFLAGAVFGAAAESLDGWTTAQPGPHEHCQWEAANPWLYGQNPRVPRIVGGMAADYGLQVAGSLLIRHYGPRIFHSRRAAQILTPAPFAISGTLHARAASYWIGNCR